jgi:hypothetical protein
MRVCAHCGELFEKRRVNCPHCGADADLTWSGDESPREFYEGWSEKDDADYRAFLEEEGLLEPAPRRAKAYPLRVMAVILLLVVAISGIIAILL